MGIIFVKLIASLETLTIPILVKNTKKDESKLCLSCINHDIAYAYECMFYPKY